MYAALAIAGAAVLVHHIIVEMRADRARRRALLRDGFARCAEFNDSDRAAVVHTAYPEITEPGPGLEVIWRNHR